MNSKRPMDTFTHYIAIGDSMSIDLYPYLDLQNDFPEVPSAVGAASLFYQNQDSIWPEFTGRDLRTLYPHLEHANLAIDGATTADVLRPEFLDKIKEYSRSSALVTVTLGGNDFLAVVTARSLDSESVSACVHKLLVQYDNALASLKRVLPSAIFMVATIYDPSDGSGILPGFIDKSDNGLIGHLDQINEHIKNWAQANNALLADVHQRFFGHGPSAPPDERWYWRPNPIEPSAKGASEIRATWLKALFAHERRHHLLSA